MTKNVSAKREDRGSNATENANAKHKARVSLKGTYHLWISRFDFFHFWYIKTTILSKNKSAFKFKKFNLKAEI